MKSQDPLAITLGIEEEFFLVDPVSGDLLANPDPAIFETCEKNCGPHRVMREFLRSQVETNTRVCESVQELRHALRETRKIVISAAEQFGAGVLGASTHPFASWQVQSATPRERYERFAATFQDNVRRFIIGGMHIHAGFGNPDSRIRVMTAVRRYLPLLHALSTSSPFSDGRETGYKSWRLTLVGGLPRTGMPSPLYSWEEYDKLVDEYRRMRFIGDGSELWWDIRPSHAYPTVEMRICDICPDIEDAVCIAALYASIIRLMLRLNQDGALPEEPLTEIIAENRWVAQRYGVLAFFGDAVGDDGRVDIDDLLARLIDELEYDAQQLGCEAEVRRALEIIRNGTGADRQVDLYRLRRLEGDSDAEALRKVVEMVLAETRAGIC